MSDDTPETGLPGELQTEGTTRRRALMLGAVGASAIISIRPALAQTQASILTCEIPVPDPARRGSYIAADGKLVPAGTPGAFAPATRPFKGQDVKRALSGGQLPGVDYERNRAYTNYIRRLQSGTSGFTCFASLQMPRG
ncbi:hypothetical protein [Sphingomonas alpina]|uniref:Uncharacterized protein n=1 Tax=Sphingomonas alpina TaxID=653931 RepID=A0A7H0LL46_9SPHN|nr:hypothetical protein [Sphingomonas alpina]QNQ10399.1 hypothetical protein H3Z74_03980 [Sphingomonas alpina]